MFGGLEILFLMFFLPFGMLTFAFWIWMLVDAAQNNVLDQNEKLAWIVVVALTHFLGALIYFFVGRSKRKLAVPA